MEWENYLLIAFVYGLGCYLSYRAGLRRGFSTGIKVFFDDLVKVAGWSDRQATHVLSLIRQRMDKERKERAISK